MASQPTKSAAHNSPGRSSGPGRLIVAVYAVFAISATARAGYQIATGFLHAPVAYSLSAFAAVVYILAAVSLAKAGPRWYWTSVVAITVELAGVLAVGGYSVLSSTELPEATVWSGFGQGYGYVPLVLPLVGLWWLYRNRAERKQQRRTP